MRAGLTRVFQIGEVTFETAARADARKLATLRRSMRIEKSDIVTHRAQAGQLRRHFLAAIWTIHQIYDPDLAKVCEKGGRHRGSPPYEAARSILSNRDLKLALINI